MSFNLRICHRRGQDFKRARRMVITGEDDPDLAEVVSRKRQSYTLLRVILPLFRIP